MYGIVEINGKRYTERFQTIPAQITVSGTTLVNGAVVLPGESKFWLKGLTREVVAGGAPVTDRRFLFKLGNSDGSIWYSSAPNAIGGTSDLVLDSLLFGTGQFPFIVVPHLIYSETASITYQYQSIAGATPYTIYMAFHGSYLTELD